MGGTLTEPADAKPFAHSLPDRPAADWEPLADHLRAVGDSAGAFAEAFGAGAMARAAGLLHDIGKASEAYQRYIAGAASAKGPDHSTAGARAAIAEYGPQVGRLIGFAVAGHHTGLMNGSGDGAGGRTLNDRLAPAYAIAAHDGWRDHAGPLPGLSEFGACRRPDANPDHPGFELAFLARMLFSCLVDADSLETERFYAQADGRAPPSRGGVLSSAHRDALRAAMARKRRDDTALNRLRAEILDHAVARAALPPGPFTLTVPTGGGKTLASLSFALEHALAHGLRRVVYVIPFTSVIEQTAEVFRDILGADAVLEHHSAFDWDGRPPDDEGDAEGEGRAGLAKLRRDAENWDAPVIVTTAVQFFESLFAARRGRCRKLHNLARAVIVLDEAQTLPVHLLRPCLAALDELSRNYGASVVLCTATQPALRRQDGALPMPEEGPRRDEPQGLDIPAGRELAPRPRALYDLLRRVRVERLPGAVDDATITARFAEQSRMLCIVNSRAHARALFESIQAMDGVRHLTTLMCARHRRRVLADVRARLVEKLPVRLVATSLIEAGVDVDFPEVWRAVAGLDSIAQAAGRCNREGRLDDLGRVVVFEPEGRPAPAAIRAFWQAAGPALRRAEERGADPLGWDAVRDYFTELYFQKGHAALDRPRDGEPILRAIAGTARRLDFPFRDIARDFRFIDEVMEPVLIPFDTRAEEALRVLEHAQRPPADALRLLQQYVVPVPAAARRALLAAGAARAIRARDYGDRFVRLESMAGYDPLLGVRIDDPTWRLAESNMM